MSDEVNEKQEQVVDQAVQAPVDPNAAPVDPDAEKRSGVKEVAQNADVMAVAKDKPPVAQDAAPGFFVKKASRHVVEVDVLSSKEDGQIASVSRTGLGIDFDKDFPFMLHTVVKFSFSLPNYEDMSTYRQRSSAYRREAQQVIVDKIQLRNHLLVWHLKDWDITDETGKKVELKFDENGALSDESLGMVYALTPTLLDVVLTLFEKDILLT